MDSEAVRLSRHSSGPSSSGSLRWRSLYRLEVDGRIPANLESLMQRCRTYFSCMSSGGDVCLLEEGGEVVDGEAGDALDLRMWFHELDSGWGVTSLLSSLASTSMFKRTFP